MLSTGACSEDNARTAKEETGSPPSLPSAAAEEIQRWLLENARNWNEMDGSLVQKTLKARPLAAGVEVRLDELSRQISECRILRAKELADRFRERINSPKITDLERELVLTLYKHDTDEVWQFLRNEVFETPVSQSASLSKEHPSDAEVRASVVEDREIRVPARLLGAQLAALHARSTALIPRAPKPEELQTEEGTQVPAATKQDEANNARKAPPILPRRNRDGRDEFPGGTRRVPAGTMVWEKVPATDGLARGYFEWVAGYPEAKEAYVHFLLDWTLQVERFLMLQGASLATEEAAEIRGQMAMDLHLAENVLKPRYYSTGKYLPNEEVPRFAEMLKLIEERRAQLTALPEDSGDFSIKK